jgi:hypothetical protein
MCGRVKLEGDFSQLKMTFHIPDDYPAPKLRGPRLAKFLCPFFRSCSAPSTSASEGCPRPWVPSPRLTDALT